MAKEKEIKKDTEKKEVEKKETKKINIKKLAKKLGKKIATSFKKLVDKTKDYVRFHKNQVVRTLTSLGILVAVVIIAIIAKNIIVGAGIGNIGYPIIYQKSNNDMYMLKHGADVKEKEQIKKMNGTGYIEYSNASDDYVLFRNELSLYIYDTGKQETTKIGDEVNVYGFSDKDSYVYLLDADNDLYSYNYKEAKQLLDHGIETIQDYNDQGIIYSKNGKLMYISFDPGKEDKTELVEGYSIADIGANNKYILYTNINNVLYRYDIKKEKHVKIDEKVDEFYCEDSNCKEFYYTKNNTEYEIYYYNGQNKKLMVTGFYTIIDIDLKKQKILYTTTTDGKLTLHYKKGNNKPVEVTSEYDYACSAVMLSDEIYYKDSKNNLNYVKIKGSKIGKSKVVSKEIQGTIESMEKGVYFYKNINKESDATYYVAQKGTAKKVADDIRINEIILSNDRKSLYYMQEINGKIGTLSVYKNNKSSKISEEVYDFVYIKDQAVYYITNYDANLQVGDLYKYDGEKTKIDERVRYIVNTTPNAENNK